ncbi:hypothetical protein FSB08_16990 [Paraburkholderia sp. JPY432]|uniref:IS66 family insertion sequence element accessory protein TnpA n=1 Tax=Paraburkholderia youngii TaxID=2782701 RepID=UPI0015963D7D|nr:hypothetical protein [Paraburkholderia youngii]NVH74204.1 hypothetical protein [Paraburkholderia youngii]
MLLVQFDQEQAATASAREEQSEAWRQRLERFVQSGQTVTAFCQQESVSAWSFYHWRRRLQRPASPRNEAAGAGTSAFVDLGAISTTGACIDPSVQAGVPSLTIRLDLPGGIVLTIARN